MEKKKNSKLFNLQRAVSLQSKRIEELTNIITVQHDQMRKAGFLLEQLDRACYIHEQQLVAASDLLKHVAITYAWSNVQGVDVPENIPLLVCDQNKQHYDVALYNGVSWENKTGEPYFEVCYWRHLESPDKLLGFIHTFNTTLRKIANGAKQPKGVQSQPEKPQPSREPVRKQTPQKDNTMALEQMKKAMGKYKEYQHLIGKEIEDKDLTDVFNRFCVYCQGNPYLELDERKQKEIHSALDRLIRNQSS